MSDSSHDPRVTQALSDRGCNEVATIAVEDKWKTEVWRGAQYGIPVTSNPDHLNAGIN